VERVVVAGGGVLGTMHALVARQHGCDVVHLERELAPRGASVRNFGLIWVSGRAPGRELGLALAARDRWEQIAAQVPGTGFRPDPSLTLATDDAELGLLTEAAALPDAAARGYQLLAPDECRSVNGALRGDFAGGLLGGLDAIVEPRLVLGAVRDHLVAASSPAAGYHWLPCREAVELAPHAVRDHAGDWHRGDLVVICPGASHTGLAGPHLAGLGAAPVRRVRLQMMQTVPFPARLGSSVADGDSLRYYPAYDLPGRARLAPQPPAAASTGAQLLLVQRLDGGLTIGDTHEYDEPFGFDLDEDAYDHLRERAEALLGTALPRVQRRWAGVYSQAGPGELYHASQAAPGVMLVTGPGGRGMTCAPAIAAETFARAGLAPPLVPPPAVPPPAVPGLERR
jgi:FAD dependent oxidoreductase TIGR03364